MAKFPEASARIFQSIFVCQKCKTKRRASIMKVLAGKVKCKKCGAYKLRPKKKKK